MEQDRFGILFICPCCSTTVHISSNDLYKVQTEKYLGNM